MKEFLDTKWTFEEAVKIISDRHEPGGYGSGPQRNSLIEAWARLVGRTRATKEIEETIGRYSSFSTAARALRMSLPTLRKLRESFASMPELDEDGVLVYFARPLATVEKLLAQFGTLVAAEGAENCSWDVREAGQGTLVRLYGLNDLDLLKVADRLAGLSNMFSYFDIDEQLRSEIHALRQDVQELKALTIDGHESILSSQDDSRKAIIARMESLFKDSTDRIEVYLSTQAVERLNELGEEYVNNKLKRAGWSWSQKFGRLLWRKGRNVAESAVTGATATGLFEALKLLL